MTIAVAPFEGRAEEWDAFGAAQRGWTHYNRHGWKQVMKAVLGHECA